MASSVHGADGVPFSPQPLHYILHTVQPMCTYHLSTAWSCHLGTAWRRRIQSNGTDMWTGARDHCDHDNDDINSHSALSTSCTCHATSECAKLGKTVTANPAAGGGRGGASLDTGHMSPACLQTQGLTTSGLAAHCSRDAHDAILVCATDHATALTGSACGQVKPDPSGGRNIHECCARARDAQVCDTGLCCDAHVGDPM